MDREKIATHDNFPRVTDSHGEGMYQNALASKALPCLGAYGDIRTLQRVAGGGEIGGGGWAQGAAGRQQRGGVGASKRKQPPPPSGKASLENKKIVASPKKSLL